MGKFVLVIKYYVYYMPAKVKKAKSKKPAARRPWYKGVRKNASVSLRAANRKLPRFANLDSSSTRSARRTTLGSASSGRLYTR